VSYRVYALALLGNDFILPCLYDICFIRIYCKVFNLHRNISARAVWII